MSDARVSLRAPPAKGEVPSAFARALLVGEPPDHVCAALAGWLDLRRGSVEEAVLSASDGGSDLLLLDGSLPGPSLRLILEAVGRRRRGERPAVLVLANDGRRSNVESQLIDEVDDFVNGLRGPDVLLTRLRRALRTRESLQELSRKNAELEGLYTRLEGLAGRMAAELRLAANLQRSLLPQAFQHPRLEVAREFIPFREIGGDYYDLVPLGEDRIAFAIGDVMGKGVPAALLAANLKACLHAQLPSGEAHPAELVARVNRLFWEITPKGLFASLVFAVLDIDRGTLRYVNAGHDHPLLVRADGSVEALATGGTVLGLVEESVYERGEAAVRRGDVLVLYSDGVSDRANRAGEAYGADRLRDAVVRSRHEPARIALYSLLGEVQGWADGAAPEDDMTLVVVRAL
jgi:serine phosphatase RsbU (regulator of sigma subunit)